MQNRDMPTIPTINMSILEAWRLFIDGVQQQGRNGWLGFEKTEQGYLEAICQSFAYALSHIDDDLDIEFIKKIHQLALESVGQTNYEKCPLELPGELRSERAHYSFTPNFLTPKGLHEIIMKTAVDQDYLTLLAIDIDAELKNLFKETIPYHKATQKQQDKFITKMVDFVKDGGQVTIEAKFEKKMGLLCRILSKKILLNF